MNFDQAVGEFAIAYADQNEKDHATLVAAVKAGAIDVLAENDKEDANFAFDSRP